MQLEAGKKHTDRRGRVYGPLMEYDGFFGESRGRRTWYRCGAISVGDVCPMDLVAEYVEPPLGLALEKPLEYRMLQDGETVQPDDEYLGYSEKWEKVPSSGNVFQSSIYYPHRRIVKPEETKAVEHAPVESPDDWVILDPVVYADHVPRVGIDQFQGWDDQWTKQESFHSKQAIGPWHTATGGNQTRCRRKDLPPVPAAETWPKWMKISDSKIASFPKEGESTNYYSSGGTSVGWAYDSYAERTWTPITEEQAKKQMADWETGRHPKTRTVVLKEWLCWENAEPETVTLAWCSTSPADETEQFSAWDNAVETGNTRTVEIPVT